MTFQWPKITQIHNLTALNQWPLRATVSDRTSLVESQLSAIQRLVNHCLYITGNNLCKHFYKFHDFPIILHDLLFSMTFHAWKMVSLNSITFVNCKQPCRQNATQQWIENQFRHKLRPINLYTVQPRVSVLPSALRLSALKLSATLRQFTHIKWELTIYNTGHTAVLSAI